MLVNSAREALRWLRGLRAHELAGLAFIAIFLVGVLFSACSDNDEFQPAPAPTATTAPAPTAAPTVAPEPTAPPTAPDADETGATVTVGDATVARYRVGEELVRLPAPIVAVGETSDVSGAIVFDADGAVVPDESALTVSMTGFVSDEDRRDNWVRRQFSAQFPNAEMTVTAVEGMPWPLPDSGAATFKLIGDMTIMGATSEVAWNVNAVFAPGAATGQAQTVITFEQFEMDKPALPFIISVEDEITLEIDIDAAVE